MYVFLANIWRVIAHSCRKKLALRTRIMMRSLYHWMISVINRNFFHFIMEIWNYWSISSTSFFPSVCSSVCCIHKAHTTTKMVWHPYNSRNFLRLKYCSRKILPCLWWHWQYSAVFNISWMTITLRILYIMICICILHWTKWNVL